MARESAQQNGSSSPGLERARKRMRFTEVNETHSTPALPEMIINTICSIVESLPAGRLEDMEPSIKYAQTV